MPAQAAKTSKSSSDKSQSTDGIFGALFFLQFFSWGVWIVPLGTYVAKELSWPHLVGIAFAMQAVGAIVAPIIIGYLTDRWLSQKALVATLLGLSSVAMAAIPSATKNPLAFLAALGIHFVFFMPTLPLLATSALQSIRDPQTRFPRIRAAGTIGWIVAGLTVGLAANLMTTVLPFYMAAIGCLLGAGVALFMPGNRIEPAHMPTFASLYCARGSDDTKTRSLRTFLMAGFLIVIPLAFYYAYANLFLQDVGARTTLGPVHVGATALQTSYQFMELALLIPLPWLIARLGTKRVAIGGMVLWMASYGLYSYAAQGHGTNLLMFMIFATALQGAGYDSIFTAGAIYLDKLCKDKDCAQAQSVFSTLTMGAGPLVGALIATACFEMLSGRSGTNWAAFWLVPVGLAGLCLIFFAVTFKDKKA